MKDLNLLKNCLWSKASSAGLFSHARMDLTHSDVRHDELQPSRFAMPLRA
jgi:hypothetical protein